MLTFQIEMYRLDEEGDLKPTNFDKKILQSKDVILLADENTKTLWIWKGSAINVRKKFLSARAAVQLNNHKGRIFKSTSIEEGSEPEEFLSLFNNTKGRTSKSITKKTKKSLSAPPPPPPLIGNVEPSFQENTPPLSPPKEMHSKSNSSIQENNDCPYKQTLEMDEVTALFGHPPEGFDRDYVIIGTAVYGAAVSKSKFLGTTTINKQYQKLENIKDGHFVAEGYIPRLIVKDKKVAAIEFIKKRDTKKEADVTKELKAIQKEVLSEDLTTAKEEEELIVYVNPLFR